MCALVMHFIFMFLCLWLFSEMAGLGYARATYDFVSEHQEDVSLHAGDVVVVLEEVDGSWLKGKNHNKVGYFPRTYVESLRLPEVYDGQQVFLAVKPFVGEEVGDLSFDDGWCYLNSSSNNNNNNNSSGQN